MAECFSCECGYDFELLDAVHAAPPHILIYGKCISKVNREPAWARCPKCGKRAQNIVIEHSKKEAKGR